MSVTVVVDGQFGSSGKGKAAVQLTKKEGGSGWDEHVAGVRCGGPNAGHTIYVRDKKYVLRLIPSIVVNPFAKLFIAAGAMVSPDLLMQEIKDLEAMGVGVTHRLMIDPETAIVDKTAVEMEKELGLGAGIGSTETGTGSTASLRSLRKTKSVMHCSELWPYVHGPVWQKLLKCIEDSDHVIIEGTQGYGLSLYHAGFYPFCTSKPTITANYIAEAGLPPQCVDNVLMVIRTYPIRVGGNSGPLPNEITWDKIQERSQCPHTLVEHTSVTKKVRRVAEFDFCMVRDAARVNGATAIAIHGLDYLDYRDSGKRAYTELSKVSTNFIQMIEREVRVPVVMGFTGPHQDDMVLM